MGEEERKKTYVLMIHGERTATLFQTAKGYWASSYEDHNLMPEAHGPSLSLGVGDVKLLLEKKFAKKIASKPKKR